MGVDITMHIINGENFVEKRIFEGRDSEWFDEITGRGYDLVYDTLPVDYGIPEICPKEVIEDFKSDMYYNFRHIKVKDLVKWFEDIKPWIEAGWATTYEKWNYENRKIVPEEGFPHYKSSVDDDEERFFIEYEKSYNSSRVLYNYLKKKYPDSIPDGEYIVYYFDY